MRAFFLCLIFIFTPATMANESFEDFLKGVKTQVELQGVDPAVVDKLFQLDILNSIYAKAEEQGLSKEDVRYILKYGTYTEILKVTGRSLEDVYQDADKHGMDRKIVDLLISKGSIEQILQFAVDRGYKTEKIEKVLFERFHFLPNFFIRARYVVRTKKEATEETQNNTMPPPAFTMPPPALTKAEKFKASQGKHLSDTRLLVARQRLANPGTLATLKAVEQRYGVDKEAIVALWSIESYFGDIQGEHHIPHVLATLAWHKKEKRNAFFKRELLIAIKIYAEGHVRSREFRGSWAGAMGQVQFMPSTFVHYAVDFDGDGKKDIWNNEADAFASAANYLSSLGWQKGAHWKTPFVLDRPITKGIFYGTGLSKQRVFKRNSEGNIVYKKGKPVIVRYRVYRLQARVFKIRGVPVPSSVNMEDHVYLFLPYGNKSGLEGYLLHNNFHVILSWNYSSYFAFGILSIMDELKKHPVDV